MARTPKGNGKKIDDPFTKGFDPQCGKFTPLDDPYFITPVKDQRMVEVEELEKLFSL